MKIHTGHQQPTIAQQKIDSGPEKTESKIAKQKTAARPLDKGDTVQLSRSLDTELKNRQAEQAKHVESIKALIKDGKYQVSSRDVAEKMLSDY